MPIAGKPAASVVRRIFKMRSQGIIPHHIANQLNDEKIPIPSNYYYTKLGKPNPRRTTHLWCAERVRSIVNNPIYLGNHYLLKMTTVSYKKHKVINKDKEDWIVIENTHEPLVSQETRNKCREM